MTIKVAAKRSCWEIMYQLGRNTWQDPSFHAKRKVLFVDLYKPLQALHLLVVLGTFNVPC